MISAANYNNSINLLFNFFKNSLMDILDVLTATDYVFFAVILFLIILLTILLFMFKNSDKNLEWENRNSDSDLLQIAREIEANDEQLNIDLTNYEKEEEEQAIISYNELIKKNKNKKIEYSDITSNPDISIKKVDVITTDVSFENTNDIDKMLVISYEKEEALLAALKQLQKNLS